MSLDTFHNFKNIGFILKVLVQKIHSTISIQTVENFEFMLEVSLQETLSTIPKKMELYSDAFHNFLKIGFILKVSLEETLSANFQQIFSENFEF